MTKDKTVAIVTDKWRLPNSPADPFVSGPWRFMYYILKKVNFPVNAVEFIELDDLMGREAHYELIIGLGQRVLKHYRPKDKFDSIRGSVLREGPKGPHYIFTFAPEELKKPLLMFREAKIQNGAIFAADIAKAKDVLMNGWQVPEERFNLAPTMEELEQFVAFVKGNNPLLGCDIEATGLNLEHSEVVVIGFAWTESDCFVLPLREEGGRSYWGKQEPKALELLKEIFNHGRFLFQNGVGYDVPLLIQQGYGFVLDNYTDELMFLHHVISPELPHNIGFISSFYGKMPYWKESFLTKKEHIFDTDQEEMRRYNARDCVALIQMYDPLCTEVKEKDQWRFYLKEMALAPIVIKAQLKGLDLNKVNLAKWRKFIDEELIKAEREIKRLKKLPSSFNLNSKDHKNWLLYGQELPAFNDVEDKLKDYIKPIYNHRYQCTKCGRKKSVKIRCDHKVEPTAQLRCAGCKATVLHLYLEKGTRAKNKDKASQVYQKLQEIKDLKSIKPFKVLNGYVIPTTDTGYSTDRSALTRYITFINKRLEQIDNLKRRAERHNIEARELRQLIRFLSALLRYNQIEKLRSSFYNFKTWSDGKVHATAMIHGTATARFSYKAPNLQQVPSGEIGQMVRDCFQAPKGYKLLSVDFSNLEVQVGGRIMSDDVLIDQLSRGLNLHDENTKIFFNADKGTARFKTLRPVAKMIQFARLFYGGSDQGIYTKAIAANPDCGLTFKGFKEAIQAYMAKHPGYKLWADQVATLAREERVAINAYGRRRELYGSTAEIERQGLNTPIQGTAAEVVQDDMIDCEERFKELDLKAFLALQVHDELIFCIPEDELAIAWHEVIKPIMSREREINGYRFKIPIDAEIGDTWGSMGSFDEETFELKGESKHV